MLKLHIQYSVICLFLLGLLLTTKIVGQSYSFNPSTIYITNVDTSQNNFGGIEVQNTGAQNLNLKWRLALKDTLIDSHFEICNSGICATNLPFSGTMPTIVPGDIGWIKFHMFSGITTGTNTIKYVLKNGTIQSDTLTFIIIVSNTTGLKNLQTIEDNFIIYPNPTNNQSTLKVKLLEASEVTVIALNTIGQPIYKTVSDFVAGNQTINLDTENWANGMYNINISTTNGTTNRKLVVVK